jgi:hypothetical protein
MTFKETIERKIEIKQAEAKKLEHQLSEANAYVQALQDVLKIHTKDAVAKSASLQTLREGSDLSKIRDMILKAGKPIHIDEILKGLGKENSKSNRTSVAGSLGSYSRQQKIFVRGNAPNTFGLLEISKPLADMELPDDFGVK